MMIARHTGYEPGVFTHFVANEQIYDRHIDAANEMLERYKELKQKESDETLVENYWDIYPRLIINDNKTNFYDNWLQQYVELKRQ